MPKGNLQRAISTTVKAVGSNCTAHMRIACRCKLNGVAIDNALSKWSEVTPRSPPNAPTTPLLQAYHGRSLRHSSLRALIRKEFSSISCIALSVRTGIALIFVLEYCALWDLEHNLNLRIITVGVQATVQLSPP